MVSWNKTEARNGALYDQRIHLGDANVDADV